MLAGHVAVVAVERAPGSMRERVPYRWSSPSLSHSPFDLVGGSRSAPQETLRKILVGCHTLPFLAGVELPGSTFGSLPAHAGSPYLATCSLVVLGRCRSPARHAENWQSRVLILNRFRPGHEGVTTGRSARSQGFLKMRGFNGGVEAGPAARSRPMLLSRGVRQHG